MTIRKRILLGLAGALLGSTGAAAQMEVQHSLVASTAQRMIAVCESYAEARGGAANIWVINYVGKPLGFARMDGANPWGGDWAHMKAATALDTAGPSSGRIPQMERRGVTQGTGMYYQLEHFPVPGGVPVLVDGKAAGAIGVDGLGGVEDEKCAQAGIDTIAIE